MHIAVEPSILYVGTPVVLVSSRNQDGSNNLAPMSSAWWLGWNCMLGLGARGHTAQNLLRERECVLNLPSDAMVHYVDRLAKLTGSDPVPPHKQTMGYRHHKDKFGISGLTEQTSESVQAVRVAECPLQMEAVLEQVHDFGHRPDKAPGALAFEVRIVRMHAAPSLLMPDRSNHIDPDRWRPLMMSFCRFYGLSGKLSHSTLASIPEEAYRPAQHMKR